MTRLSWDNEKLMYVSFLIESGMTNPDIAKLLNTTSHAINNITCKKLNGNNNYYKSNIKHKHLRKEVLNYFLNHTMEQTAKHFNLSLSELKSCLTYAYKEKRYLHLRKDKRRHDSWSTKELIIALKLSGLVDRSLIAKILKRGTYQSVKECYSRLNINSKSMNGITYSKYKSLFSKGPSKFLKTTAGPCGGFIRDSNYKIIPWTILRDEIESGYIKPSIFFCNYVESMCLFYDWIYEGQYSLDSISNFLVETFKNSPSQLNQS